MRFFLFLLFIFLFSIEISAVPIETPEVDERNKFVIKCPDGWGYRTFKGENGLIGVMWPAGTTFNLTDTAVFIFVQNNKEELPKLPDNINLFTEKCPKAKFKFTDKSEEDDPTLSLGEKYFSGRCGRTMLIIKETIDHYNIIMAVVSAKYITKSQLAEIKEAAGNYRHEVEKYLKALSKEESNNYSNS